MRFASSVLRAFASKRRELRAEFRERLFVAASVCAVASLSVGRGALLAVVFCKWLVTKFVVPLFTEVLFACQL